MYENSVEFMFHEARLKSRRQLVGIMIAFPIILTILYCIILLIPPIQGILRHHEQLLASQVEGMKKIPNLQETISKLESQVQILTTESIDNRLQIIEKAIHVGNLKKEDIATVQDLKKEIEVLKSYMFRDPKELVELKELQKNYQVLLEKQNNSASKEMLNNEVSGVRNLLYLSLGFFGILFTVLFGSWWFINNRATKSESAPTKAIKKEAE